MSIIDVWLDCKYISGNPLDMNFSSTLQNIFIGLQCWIDIFFNKFLHLEKKDEKQNQLAKPRGKILGNP